MVEFSLAFPVFLAILAVAFTGSQFITTSVGIHSAARAAALAASNDVSANSTISPATELNDAVDAANLEEGCNSCFTGVSSQSACPSTGGCIWITHPVASVTIELVHVSQPVAPWVPLLRTLTISAQAGASP